MTTVLSADGQPADGRLRRGARTRDAIVRSYIELLGSGERTPRAENIAQRAGVGIRTVYNQFRDMEGLRAEAGALVWAQIEKYIVRDVPRGASLDERLDLFVGMRSQLLETLAPYARSAQGHHAKSGELRRQRSVLVKGSKRELSVTFRPELSRREGHERDQFLDALHAVSSSSAWSGLRDELDLDVPDATAVFRVTLGALLRS
jgi:AcrR family transcriptional regulator